MLVKVKVKPKQKKNNVILRNKNSFLVETTADTKNNKANLAVLDLLKEYLGINNISIKRGHKMRNKLISIPDDYNQIDRAVEVLNNGGVIIYPTDTVYGIGCDINNERAIEKLISIKKRSNNPMSVAVSSIDMIKQVAVIEDNKVFNLLPGPFTFILKKKKVSDSITSGLPTVGVRIPDNDIALKIIEKFGKPIITTSANISNKPSPKSLKEVDISADFMVQGECKYKLGSTVVDLKNKKILRNGAGDKLIQKYV
jgi:L-threonylcarbamoyladenylate synthase